MRPWDGHVRFMQPEAQATTCGSFAVSAGALEIATVVQGTLEVLWHTFMYVWANSLLSDCFRLVPTDWLVTESKIIWSHRHRHRCSTVGMCRNPIRNSDPDIALPGDIQIAGFYNIRFRRNLANTRYPDPSIPPVFRQYWKFKKLV